MERLEHVGVLLSLHSRLPLEHFITGLVGQEGVAPVTTPLLVVHCGLPLLVQDTLETGEHIA